MKLRVGLIGLGNQWEARHRPALRTLSDRFEVCAVCDQIALRAEHAAREWNAQACDGFRSLAQRPDIDAVLMLGTVANSFGADRWWFLVGTLVASLTWFFGLGYGARLLRGLFARPTAWRVLDSAIAVVMGALGVGLLAH